MAGDRRLTDHHLCTGADMPDSNSPFPDLLRHQAPGLDGNLIDRLLYGAYGRSQQFQPLEIVERKKRHLVWNAQAALKLRLNGSEGNQVIVGKKGCRPVRIAKEIDERNLGFMDSHADDADHASGVRLAHCLLETGDTLPRIP
jgi:hypothetical protein